MEFSKRELEKAQELYDAYVEYARSRWEAGLVCTSFPVWLHSEIVKASDAEESGGEEYEVDPDWPPSYIDSTGTKTLLVSD